ADQLDKKPEEVQLTTNFKNDLDADSLDIFEIINEIEDEFDVKIDTDESIETVADLVNFITEKAEA
ncbi:acyl carrier protein, partial [Vibrio parahaemolyticus]